MQTTRSTSSTILLILVLVLTAPIWLTVGGVLIGVFGGIVGVVFGAFGALVGGFFSLLALPFNLVFGSCDVFDDGFHLSGKTLFFLCVVLLVVAAMRRK